jgi:Ca-activated chloride channel family protein
MRSLWLAVLVGAIVAGPVAASQTFRADVRAVAVYATVKDQSGRLVTDLRQEDFRVFDEGRPVALELFDATPQPMDVVLLFDTSMSMTGSLTTLRDAAAALLARLGPQDRVRMGAFSDAAMFGPAFSADPQELMRQIPRTIGANMTRLYDALVETFDEFDGSQRRSRRKVVVVLSDGADTASSADRDAVVTRARKAEAMIYAIGLTRTDVEKGRPVVRPPDRDLRHIAEETGGGYLEPTGSNVSRDFERVVNELHGQYLLGFLSPADGRVHALSVRVTRAGCTVHSRRSYLAPKAGTGH